MLLILAGVLVAGCASTGAPARPYQHGDNDYAGDGTPGGGGDDQGESEGDDSSTRRYGHEASSGEARAVADVVRRFYAAAAAENGAGACALIARHISNSRRIADLLPEAYRPAPGSSVLRGKSCPAVESFVFEVEHDQRVAESETLVVTDVRVEGSRGLALLGFRTLGEREIQLRLEDHRWRIDALLDAGIT